MASVRALLAKAMGLCFEGVPNQGLPPTFEASTWIVTGSERSKYQGVGVVDDGILDMLEDSTISGIPGKVCVFLEQLAQRGHEGGQAWNEGAWVCYHA